MKNNHQHVTQYQCYLIIAKNNKKVSWMTLEEQIGALSEEYRDYIRPELEVLRTYISRLQTGAYSPEDMRSLQHLAHMQSGSAGSFGFDQLAEKAKATDLAMIQGTPIPELVQHLKAWDAALSATLV